VKLLIQIFPIPFHVFGNTTKCSLEQSLLKHTYSHHTFIIHTAVHIYTRTMQRINQTDYRPINKSLATQTGAKDTMPGIRIRLPGLCEACGEPESINSFNLFNKRPIPVAAPSKAWVCGCSLAGIAGSNPSGIMDVCLLCVLCVVR